jgi:hypothetical protein
MLIESEIARVKDLANSKDGSKSIISKDGLTPLSPIKPEKTKTIDPFEGGMYIKSSTPVKVKYEEKGARKVKVIFDKDESSRGEFDKNSITDQMDRDY